MPLITVSRVTHAKLTERARPGAALDDSKTEFLPNGFVRFPVGDDTYAAMMKISPDPEAAILKALGCASN